MVLSTAADWLTWGGLVLPLLTLAWSAVQFVRVKQRESRQHQFENFFLVLERVHNAQGSLIQQKAAIFELRNYPAYRDFILRLCENASAVFKQTPGDLIMNEFALTADYLRGIK